jgi:molybdopterin biosynthesis enzyme
MSNPWVAFGALIAPGAKAVVTITAVNTDGTSLVELRGGGSLRVQGDNVTQGSKALIQGGRIIGAAPALPTQAIEV